MKTKIKLLSIAIIFLVGATMLSMLPHQAKSATSGLVGYWKFDEGSGNIAHDSSGNGNDGTINTATWTDGKVGKALHFNGVDSWVQIPNSPTLTALSQITLEAWVKEDSISPQLKGIISKCDGAAPPTNAEYYLGMGDSGKIGFETYNGVAIFSGSTTTRYITEAGKWYHVAGTWTGNAWAIYVNGVQVLSGTCTPQTTRSNTLDVQIGRHGSWSWVYFNGIIDEVRIYNRALTSDEIYNDYTGIEQTPFWVQWWFWTILALGVLVVVLAFTTVHYRKKPSVSKETSVLQSKTIPKTNKVCPKCGANLPADSKFCGKCGTSLE